MPNSILREFGLRHAKPIKRIGERERHVRERAIRSFMRRGEALKITYELFDSRRSSDCGGVGRDYSAYCFVRSCPQLPTAIHFLASFLFSASARQSDFSSLSMTFNSSLVAMLTGVPVSAASARAMK